MRALLPALCIACATPAPEPEAEPGLPQTLLLRRISFVEVQDGVSFGFDLDDHATALGDDVGCGRADATSPAGEPGVDNAFGPLVSLIANLGGEALQSLLQGAVTSGELLIALRVAPEPGPTGCHPGEVIRAEGAPMLGTDGAILAWQSFGPSTEIPATPLDCAVTGTDGALDVDGITLRLPLAVFDETIDLTLEGGRARLVPQEDGRWTGYLAGGISVAALRDNVLGFDAIPEALEQGTVAAIELAADLAPDDDGECTQISVTLAVEAVPMFLYEDAG